MDAHFESARQELKTVLSCYYEDFCEYKKID